MIDEIVIGDRRVGTGHPCFVIAEIGSNHNQDLDLARRLIDAAAEAGADAVKFQTFRASEHYSSMTPGFSYLGGTDTYGLIQSLELNRDWHAVLKQHAEDHGVEFFSSPCDVEAIDELDALGVRLFKVASFDLPDTDLIARAAATGKPVVLSTGMANLDDIRRAVETCRAVGNEQIALLQCTSLYPAPAALSNLAAMAMMRETFGTLVGYSDHTEGDHIPIAAVAQGATVIEKHFTLDRNLPGPDHPFAIEPADFTRMIARIREVEVALGDGRKDGPREAEREMFDKGRRSLHARVSIAAGETITESMLVTKRPGLGIEPHLRSQVIGRKASRDIPADQWITWEML